MPGEYPPKPDPAAADDQLGSVLVLDAPAAVEGSTPEHGHDSAHDNLGQQPEGSAGSSEMSPADATVVQEALDVLEVEDEQVAAEQVAQKLEEIKGMHDGAEKERLLDYFMGKLQGSVMVAVNTPKDPGELNQALLDKNPDAVTAPGSGFVTIGETLKGTAPIPTDESFVGERTIFEPRTKQELRPVMEPQSRIDQLRGRAPKVKGFEEVGEPVAVKNNEVPGGTSEEQSVAVVYQATSGKNEAWKTVGGGGGRTGNHLGVSFDLPLSDAKLLAEHPELMRELVERVVISQGREGVMRRLWHGDENFAGFKPPYDRLYGGKTAPDVVGEEALGIASKAAGLPAGEVAASVPIATAPSAETQAAATGSQVQVDKPAARAAVSPATPAGQGRTAGAGGGRRADTTGPIKWPAETDQRTGSEAAGNEAEAAHEDEAKLDYGANRLVPESRATLAVRAPGDAFTDIAPDAAEPLPGRPAGAGEAGWSMDFRVRRAEPADGAATGEPVKFSDINADSGFGAEDAVQVGFRAWNREGAPDGSDDLVMLINLPYGDAQQLQLLANTDPAKARQLMDSLVVDYLATKGDATNGQPNEAFWSSVKEAYPGLRAGTTDQPPRVVSELETALRKRIANAPPELDPEGAGPEDPKAYEAELRRAQEIYGELYRKIVFNDRLRQLGQPGDSFYDTPPDPQNPKAMTGESEAEMHDRLLRQMRLRQGFHNTQHQYTDHDSFSHGDHGGGHGHEDHGPWDEHGNYHPQGDRAHIEQMEKDADANLVAAGEDPRFFTEVPLLKRDEEAKIGTPEQIPQRDPGPYAPTWEERQADVALALEALEILNREPKKQWPQIEWLQDCVVKPRDWTIHDMNFVKDNNTMLPLERPMKDQDGNVYTVPVLDDQPMGFTNQESIIKNIIEKGKNNVNDLTELDWAGLNPFFAAHPSEFDVAKIEHNKALKLIDERLKNLKAQGLSANDPQVNQALDDRIAEENSGIQRRVNQMVYDRLSRHMEVSDEIKAQAKAEGRETFITRTDASVTQTEEGERFVDEKLQAIPDATGKADYIIGMLEDPSLPDARRLHYAQQAVEVAGVLDSEGNNSQKSNRLTALAAPILTQRIQSHGGGSGSGQGGGGARGRPQVRSGARRSR